METSGPSQKKICHLIIIKIRWLHDFYFMMEIRIPRDIHIELNLMHSSMCYASATDRAISGLNTMNCIILKRNAVIVRRKCYQLVGEMQ